MNYRIVDHSPIKLSNLSIPIEDLQLAIGNTNDRYVEIYKKTGYLGLNFFSILDFRVLSGLIGESFSVELCSINSGFVKNPYIDGYPDLLQNSTPIMKRYFSSCQNSDFIKYKYGGLEVKNTFGTKKANSFLLIGDQRINYINKKLDWKAHHRETNYLVALLSDYVEGLPKIVALFYSDSLKREDWAAIPKPKTGSAMTSFSAINSSGFAKLKEGLKICLDKPEYLNYTRL